ncbi:hypothetical protein [Azospirillum sp. SYSU D00513]|uniref:hypothetical protein n=1 Tax=Azospirillum sp. SYSU D00513 TaxID=2812561 RepID=UPI001A964A7E|nr:hypothetical protein [Azospirillum sp. SYSU D00513]
MLRVTVTRESSTSSVAIAEVVIGKFAGSEQRGGYAARVYEPASPFSEGVDACFTVRGHERFQPAFALVASVLRAWHDGQVEQVSDGMRQMLSNASALRQTQTSGARTMSDTDRGVVTHQGTHAGMDDDSLLALQAAVQSLSHAGNGRVPSAAAIQAATALLTGDSVALQALATAVNAVAAPGGR